MDLKSDEENLYPELSSSESKLLNNECSPIYRLPPELLLRIFCACAADLRHLNAYGLAVLIKVTHVCKHWRELAIADPLLWSYIDLRFSRGAEEMVRRSKPVPLTIHINILLSSTSSWIASARLVLGELYRTKHLYLTYTLGPDSEHVFSDVVFAAPLLETLSLYTDAKKDSHFVSELISSNATRLRKFESRGAVFHRNILLSMNGLTRLILHFDDSTFSHFYAGHVPPSRHLTFEQLLQLLEGSPTLEHLELSNALRYPPLNESSIPKRIRVSDPHVVLPHLKFLQIFSHTTDGCVGLLESMHFPPTTILNVDYIPFDDSQTSFVRLLTRIAKSQPYIQPEYTVPIRTLSIALGKQQPLKLKMWTERISISDIDNVPPLISLAIAMIISLNDELIIKNRDALKLLYENLPLHHLQFLFIGTIGVGGKEQIEDITVDLDMWTTLIQNIPTIQDLTISGRSVLPFIGALSRKLVACATTKTAFEELPLPCLQNLVLRHASLENILPSPWTALEVEAKEVLMDLLMLRCEFGSGINKLSVIECRGVYEKDIKFFGEIVVDVEWKGLINPQLPRLFFIEEED